MAESETSDSESLDVRIGRILNAFHDRRARGEAVSEAALLAAHPDLADALRPYLEMLGDLRPADDKIETLIEQGLLAASDDPHHAAELGPYKILGFIGRGGMGIVLKAYEESLNRTVALKILRPELADDQTALGRFTREAKAAAALRHPNIVTVHAVGKERGAHYLAMEYVEGASLADVIRDQGPLPTDTIRRLFHQVLSGLSAAHEAGLIHRDIKSANLLLDCGLPISDCGLDSTETLPVPAAQSPIPDPQSPIPNPQSAIVKVADFGLARMLTAQTRLTIGDSVLGTAEYMSPEQARGDESLDHRTDLYSAGVVLYEMLTGRTPFRADSPSAVIHRILHDTPANPRTINHHADPHLASLALRLMAKRSEDRFASATEAVEALEAAEPVKSPERRRWLRRMVAAGLLAVSVGLAALWSWNRFNSRIDTMSAGAGTRPPITQIWVEKGQETTILARYGDDPTPRVFRGFQPEVIRVRVPPLVDLDGNGRVAVVAALEIPFEDHNLFAFDAEGKEMWRIHLSSSRQWPDCGPSAQWGCRRILAGDLDGKPGDELIVIASDPHEYPTRVSILDPRKGEILGTFWHTGQLFAVRIFPGFLESGRPAVVAWGQNNKLDGLGLPYPSRPYECSPGEDPPRTRYDVVTVAMVLDPVDINGLGPPRTTRERVRGLEVARPVAYAFLDSPQDGSSGTYIPEGQTQRVRPVPSEIAYITEIVPLNSAQGGQPGPFLKVGVGHPQGSGWQFIVDRSLKLHDVVPVTGEMGSMSKDDLGARWRPIIQRGNYVEQ